jgi:hypothetical protein
MLIALPLTAALLQVGGSTEDASGVTSPHLYGVSIPGAPSDLAPLTSFETMVGRRTDIVNWYVDFTTPGFDAKGATAVSDRGTTPMITWEPWDSSLADPLNQPAYSLESIIDGSRDNLLVAWATGVAAWGKPLLIRFAHEMNGNWYPWSEGVNGNTGGQYVLAWRHVHDIFVSHGATNVKWVWSPNVDYPGSTPLTELYPGDRYVDEIGIDGYNWGTSQSWSSWQSPGQVFHQTIADVRTFTRKPVLLSEVASAGQGGSKAQWITHFFAWLETTPAVAGFVWFDYNKETDWRVNSSAPAEAAFVKGLAGY